MHGATPPHLYALKAWCSVKKIAQGQLYLYLTSHIEEIILRVFKNRVLKRIFGPKGKELLRFRRKLHN
jgi:hypothetical protein